MGRLATLAVVLVAGHGAPAAGDPMGSRVLTTPTAWLLPDGAATATLALDHRGDGAVIVGYGLGRIAELELGGDSDVRACAACAQPPVVLGRASFRLGAPQDVWPGMPAIALGVRTTFAARGHAVHEPRASDAYVVASRALGALWLHAGVDAIAASVDQRRLGARVRPLVGGELHPPAYPRSSLLVDLAWLPTLDAQTGPTVGWMFGVGVRYQAFRWGSIELAVRARQGEDLGASTVMLRVNAVLLP